MREDEESPSAFQMENMGRSSDFALQQRETEEEKNEKNENSLFLHEIMNNAKLEKKESTDKTEKNEKSDKNENTFISLNEILRNSKRKSGQSLKSSNDFYDEKAVTSKNEDSVVMNEILKNCNFKKNDKPENNSIKPESNLISSQNRSQNTHNGLILNEINDNSKSLITVKDFENSEYVTCTPSGKKRKPQKMKEEMKEEIFDKSETDSLNCIDEKISRFLDEKISLSVELKQKTPQKNMQIIEKLSLNENNKPHENENDDAFKKFKAQQITLCSKIIEQLNDLSSSRSNSNVLTLLQSLHVQAEENVKKLLPQQEEKKPERLSFNKKKLEIEVEDYDPNKDNQVFYIAVHIIFNIFLL